MSFIKRFKTFLLAAVLSVAVLGVSPKVYGQASITQYVASDVNDSIAESSATSATAQFNSNTKAGSLLVAFCFGENDVHIGYPLDSANIPVCSTPTTPGLTWTPITQEGVLGGYGPLQPPTEQFSVGYTVAVYYVANAPSISSSTITTDLLSGGAYSDACPGTCIVAQQIILFELGGMASSNVVDTYAESTGPYTENPQTSPLVTANTDFILSAFESSNTLWDYPTYGAGPGYTEFLDTTDPAVCEDIYDTPTCYWPVQYISNAPAGTIPTAWGNVGMTVGDSWASVAVAFKTAATPPTPPSPPNFQYTYSGYQPWETTEGEVSLDTLNVNVNIPVVDKDGVGLPFAFALNFNNNFWFLGNCDNSSVDPGVTCWQPNSNNFGWMPDASQMYGAYVAIPTICPDSVGNGGSAALDFVAYQDPQGNMHPIDPNTVISFSGNTCNYPGTKAVVSTDGSGYTYNLAFPTDGQTFSNVDQAIPIVGTGTPQVVASNGTVMTPGIIYYNNPGALGNSAVPWGMPNYITGISSEDTNSNTISTPAQLSWPVHHIAPVGPWTFTDTVGVGEVAVAPETFVGPPNSQLLGPSGPGGPCAAGGTQTYTYPTSTGTASATVGCQQYTIATNFQCPVFDTATQAYVNAYEWPFIDHVSSFQAYLPSSVTLADGSQYQFTYESQLPGTTSGRLANITYPDGSVVYYAYPGANNGTNCYDGSLIGLIRTSPDGVTNYSRTQTGVAVGSHLYNTTTVVGPAPAYNTSVYTFNQQPAGYHQSEFMVQEQDYQGLSTLNNPLKSVVYCYNGNQSNCVTTSAPTYPITQKDVYTTLAGMSTSNRVSKTYDAYGNTTGVSFYDFGVSTFTRKMVLSNFGQSWNGSTSSPACTSIGNGVNSVPCQAELLNSSGVAIGNTFYSYNSAGKLLTTSDWASGSITSGVYLTSSVSYNANGTISTVTDAAGNSSSYAYSSSVCNNGKPVSITVPGSLVSTLTWDSGCNGSVPNTLTDPNGKTSTIAYNDPLWRITKITDQAGQAVNTFYTPTTTESIVSFQSSILDIYHQVNPVSLTTYDQQLEGPGSASWDSVVFGWKWSNSGVENYGYPPCAGIKAENCATVGISTNIHDALNRSLVVTDGGGGTINKSYIGQDILTVVGPAPIGEVVKQVQNEYNGLGQLLSTCEISNTSQPLSNAISCGQANGGYVGYLITYIYNPNGTVASVSKKSSIATQTHLYTYDVMGRLLTATYPESGTTTYTYDSSTGTCAASVPGQLVRVNDANGNQACYTYDGLNRNTSITYTGPNFDGYNQYFVYDKAVVDGVAMPNSKGHIAEAYAASTIHGTKYIDEGFGYTARGELSDVYEYTTNSKVYHHVAATYYANGALNSISGITGGPWTYGIDGKGRPNSVTDASSTLFISNVTYNSSDQPLVLTYGSGDNDTYTYDPLTGRMTSYAFTIGTAPKTNLGSLVWNSNGTLNSLTVVDNVNSTGSQTCNYGTSSNPGYDSIGRLLYVSCTNGSANLWAQNFSYDVFDNLTKTVPAGDIGVTWNPGYNSVNNQPTGTTVDSNGNLLTDTFHTYTWNQNNKVTGVTDSGITTSHDAFGSMVERYDGTTYTQTILSPIGNLGLWSGKPVKQFRIPLPGGATAVSGINYWHKDWLGSVRLVSGLTLRNSVTDKAFAPYGETYSVSPSGNTTDLNFTGDNQDLVAGTYDTPSRELNPTQGRWISPDPLHSGWNAYAYSTNPLSAIDPSGNQDDSVDGSTSIVGPADPIEATGTTFVANIDCAGSCVVTSIYAVNNSFGVSEYANTWDFGAGLEGVEDVLVPAQLESQIASVVGPQNENGGLVSQNGNIIFIGGGLLNNVIDQASSGSLINLLVAEDGSFGGLARGHSLSPKGNALFGEPPIGYEGQGQYGKMIVQHINSRIGNVTGTHLITELGRLADTDENPLMWDAIETLDRIKFKGNSAQYEIVRNTKLLNHFNSINWTGPRADKYVLPPNGISEKDLIFLNKAQSKSLWFWKSWDDYHIPGTRF